MTTTMQEMRNVVEYAKEKGVTAKIMIGGAVITQDYADEIHADGYSRDAADAVRLYENNYYQRVSDELYEQLLAAKQQIEEAVQPQDSTK